jgi:hypothetical protein
MKNFALLVLCGSVLNGADVAQGEVRTYLLGDKDGGIYNGAGSVDDVPVMPAWITTVNANTPSNHTEGPFDSSLFNQNVPFTFTYPMGPSEGVRSATLTLGVRGTTGGPAGVVTDAVTFYFATGGVFSYADMGWNPVSQSVVETRTMNLANSVTSLAGAGKLDVVVRDDSLVDFAELSLTIGLLGDASNDGVVNFNDFVILSQNFGKAGGWSEGNFVGSGMVDFNDFVVLSQHFGESVGGAGLVVGAEELAAFEAASAAFFGGSGVPEPASLAILGTGAVALLRRLRR